jgi:uncharacterized membrane-anchored protein YhcB (DUF1043 family)
VTSGAAKLLLTIIALAASLVAGLAVGYVAMEILPCRWFGSGFEGGCAYGVLWTSVSLALAVALLSFGFLVYRIFHRRARVDNGDDNELS